MPRTGGRRGPCSPRFYASYNFESYDIHDNRSGRFYFIALVGVNAAIYSLKSAAEDALPPRGKFTLIRCRTIREAVLQWCKWCTDNHSRTCSLAELANDIDLPSAVVGNGNIVPDSEEELLADVPLHKRRYVSVIDLPLPSETHHQLRPLIFPIDAATARRLKLTFDGAPLPDATSATGKRKTIAKRETTAKRGTSAKREKQDQSTPSSKRHRAPRHVSPSPSTSPSPKLPLWADETPPKRQFSTVWIDDTPPAGGPSLALPESPTRGLSLSAHPPKSLTKPVTAVASTMPTSRTRTTSGRSAYNPTNSSTAISSTANSSPANTSRAQRLLLGSLVVGDRRWGERINSPGAKHPVKFRRPPQVSNVRFFYNETKKIYLSVTRAIAGMAADDELSVMTSPEEIQLAVDEGSRKGKGVERGLVTSQLGVAHRIPPHRTDDLVLSAAEHSTLSHATSGDAFDMSAPTVPQGPVSSTESILQPLDGGEGEGGYVANQEDKDLDSGNPAPPPPSPAATPSPPRPTSPSYDDNEPWGGIDNEPWGGISNNSDEEPWGGISGNHSADDLPAPTNKVRKPFPRLGDLDDDDDALPNVEGVTTWASRNPGKAVIPPRQRPKRVLGAEQRRTAKDRVKSKKGGWQPS
ncbi:hypothetical protein B0H14DRAFT_2587049 [Mycena olivaceomarginata]|nr:hypothetical protein B0H14DRAFT_2587049 [Mycena olivaceomarginata]